jgi:uncharacterized protein (TIGR02452 family)
VSLAGVAKETVAIVERGEYTCPSGQVVSIRAEVDAAIAGTVLHRPGDLDDLPRPAGGGATRIEVWADTTGGAARRLAAEGPVAALNFASAKNPGGGFMGGAKAQEEDLARCSALYHCVRTQRGYYDANRAEPSMLYTDHVIYSPRVPFFRDERLELLARPFCASVVTAPAPNAGEHLRRDPRGRADIAAALDRRAEYVLRVLAHHGERVLVLGAWGCGVFRNDPAEVAGSFAARLAGAYAGVFARVVFAIHERGRERPTLQAFARALGVAADG